MRSPVLIGLDLGTSSAKGAAFDLAGRALASAEYPYRYEQPAPGWAEMNAEIWWHAAREILRALSERIAPARVRAVGVSGQAPTLLAVDGDGRPVRPAILWLDVRSEDEAAVLALRLPPGMERASGNRLHAYYLGPKLAWLRAREPERLARTATVLQSHSFPVMRLTGERVTDYSSASLAAPLYDALARAWSPTAASALGVPMRLLPRLAPAHAVAGTVTEAAARETGLDAGTPVVVGGADFAASTLAGGVTEPGEACLMLGTAGNLIMPFTGARFDTRFINAHHVGADRYLALGATLAGAVLEWLRGVAAPDVPLETLDAEADRVAVGADGVTLLPYLQGERTPVWDAGARGAFIGLSLAHGRGHLWRAALEAVAVSFRHAAEVAREQGLALHEVIAVNGGGKSAVWRRIIADALGVPLLHAPDHAGAPGGAALLAGIGSGELASVAVAKTWRGPLVRHEPDHGRSLEYARLLALRQELYASLRKIG